MLSITIGGRAPHYSDRGVNGALADVLLPIQHGILFYPGMAVLPPFTTHQVASGTRIHLVHPGEPKQLPKS